MNPAIRAALVLCAVLLLDGTPGAQVRLPVLAIVSPRESAFVAGHTLLRARVEPAAEATSVIFYVDGLQVCALSRPPFECDWDAGVRVVEHQIRAVATFTGARHMVSTARTRGLDYAESVDVRSVQLTATVSDNRGHFVKGLPQSAFRVFEDGRPQTISHFEAENVALDLIVALDISGSMGPSMPALKQAAREFLTAIPTTNKVTLLAFNDTSFTLARGATDPVQRIRAVDGLVPWGGTALYDVLVRGVDMFGADAGRKALIVFTDGEDFGSGASLEEAEARLQASDVTLYMIGQGKGITLEPLKRVMHRLTDPTGGLPLFVERTDELRGVFSNLLDELSNQYLVSYSPTNTTLDGTMRTVRVEVQGSYRVRARTGYRAALEEQR
ncbi:MAG TPA: VWA domain-containing protein [Vicinamibacterales bacterium]|nr:VWA domain-containing protein [Vicinamibacterales bacterium]